LFSRGGNSQSSLAKAGIGLEAAELAERITVPVVTLDSYVAENGLPQPRWVKIDAEGAEICILEGSVQLLASEANILCELHPYAWPDFGKTFVALQNLVAASGRRIRYIDETAAFQGEPRYGCVLLERL